MSNLKRLGLDKALKDAVAQGKPVLGICIGCQVVMDYSEEDLTDCLGLIPGKVLRFPASHQDRDGARLKVPHMGWNEIRFTQDHPVFRGLPQGADSTLCIPIIPSPRMRLIAWAYAIMALILRCHGQGVFGGPAVPCRKIRQAWLADH